MPRRSTPATLELLACLPGWKGQRLVFGSYTSALPGPASKLLIDDRARWIGKSSVPASGQCQRLDERARDTAPPQRSGPTGARAKSDIVMTGRVLLEMVEQIFYLCQGRSYLAWAPPGFNAGKVHGCDMLTGSGTCAPRHFLIDRMIASALADVRVSRRCGAR